MDTATIDSRRERGLALAKASRIKQVVEHTYLVPSATSRGARYIVDVSAGTCTCPDHELRGDTIKCKHRWAVEYARHQVMAPDGSTTVLETLRIRYPQESSYTAAQCEEKNRVQVLLRALCDGIQNPVQVGRGNRILPLSDVVYAATMKVFVGMSGRRATSDVRACEEKGFISTTPSHCAISEYLSKPTLTPILTTLVQESAEPLAAVDGPGETVFAADGTGFSTSVYHRYFDHKHGKPIKEATWMKLHAMCGVRTNIVTAAIVTDGTKHDSPELPKLIEMTNERFTMREVLADKGYIGIKNLNAIEAAGAVPYIPFKSNSKGDGAALWKKMWHYYSFHREDFLQHYHQRSNVEAVFSSIKRKFGGSIRSKNYDARVNEVLLKVLCHNLSCLVRSIHALGIEPHFWGSTLKAVGT